MIRLSPVRLVDDYGSQVGIVSVEQALEIERLTGLDLVAVAPATQPVVSKIADWERYRREQHKRARAARRREHHTEVKWVDFRPGVAEHDFPAKVAMVRRFVEQGKQVKITITCRRRGMRRRDNG